MEKIDVLFINPGDRKQVYQGLGNKFCAIEPPAFAGLYATYAKHKGLSSAILDIPALFISANEAARLAVEDFNAALVVIPVYGFQPSASTQVMSAAGAITGAIKDASPNTPILLMGTHPAALPERTMREEACDFVCDLEGPVTITKTVEALKAGITDFSNIPSLWWRDENRIVKPRAIEPLITELDDEMPGIAWDLIDMNLYRAHNWHSFEHINERSPYAAIHTSLGCPYKCSFCCINAPFGKSSYRMWSPKLVVKEIDKLVYEYGVKNIKFVDEMFVLNRNHVLGICDLLGQKDYKVNIWAYARVDTVQEEFLDKLKNAGVEWLCLGIESASGHVRDGAHKIYTNEDIIDVCRRIQGAGINIIGNYIFGLPDDTLGSMQSTLDLALELNCEFSNFYSAMAYPGSQLYSQALQSGARLPEKWHHYSQHAFESLPLENEHCSSTEILKFRDEAWTKYFTNPSYLNMIGGKFGHDVVNHVKDMTSLELPRKLYQATS